VRFGTHFDLRILCAQVPLGAVGMFYLSKYSELNPQQRPGVAANI
jgi:hypothetical protein